MRPVVRFLALFGVLLAVYYAFTVTPWFLPGFLDPYLRFNAELSAALLNLLGQETSCLDTSILSPRFSVRIARGCDAVDPSAIYIAGVLAFPASAKWKLSGAVAGAIGLMLLNFVRIVGLFFTGVYFPRAFDTMHHDVGQALFIFMALLFWFVWSRRAVARDNVSSHASA